MSSADNLARVEGGFVAGASSPNGAVRIFKGIPYASPPVAELRWKPPQPVDPWQGVRPATSFGPRCVQVPRPRASIGYFPPEPESEDCLYLNVWAPAAKARVPVMVWFHGGAYNMGSGSLPLFDGEAFARQGVVLVTMNYRLGRLGFLSHPDLSAESEHRASGNYGLMDQIAALRWVQNNIAEFGGDPSCVTIFGQSCGSYSVNYYLTSPLTKGLFHRAIGESGAGFGPVGYTSGTSEAIQALLDAEKSGVALAERIGAKSAAELRSRSPYEVQMARVGDGFEPGRGYDRFSALRGAGAFDTAYPIVDGYVIPDAVREIYARGEQHQVPLMTGSNAQERGTTVQPAPSLEGFIADAKAQLGDLADQYLKAYPAKTDAESNELGGYAIGDRIFTWQNWTWAKAHAQTKKAPVFFYRFTRVPPHPKDIKYIDNPNNIPRSYHGAELPYVFRSFACRDWPWEPVDHTLSNTMSSYWVNFAKTGDPNGPGLPQWPQFNPDSPAVMFLGTEIGPGPIPNKDRLDLWDAFYDRQPKSMAEHLARR